ncbi:MAG: TolC family protein [Desulfobulbaceae bacterium]|nr:TolC family protein [Candidatus Kapabacteria bacterium]MBS4001211.1 TolC family protein [Desulfobulbaceae bacterium]
MMIKLFKNISLVAFSLIIMNGQVLAQGLLTLEDALKLAFANNHAVLFASKQSEIDQNNNSIGTAGFLPSLDANAGLRKSVLNVNQLYLDGREVNRTGAVSDQLDAGIALNWTIFDGTRMFLRKEQLAEMQRIGELEYKNMLELSATDIINQYFLIVRIKAELINIEESLEISRERMSLTELRETLGKLSKFDVLQAKTDLNSDIADSIDATIEYQNAKIELKRMIGIGDYDDFDVESEIELLPNIAETPNNIIENQNTQLLLAKQNQKLADLESSISNSNFLPRVNAFGAYNWARAKSQSGFLSENTSYGLNYGLNLSLNIFDGLNSSRESENAQIRIEMSDILYRQTAQSVFSELRKVQNTYNALKMKLDFELENIAVAEENMALATDRLNLGIITPLEFREVQNKLNIARTRLTETKYQLKQSETTLLKITGNLISGN